LKELFSYLKKYSEINEENRESCVFYSFSSHFVPESSSAIMAKTAIAFAKLKYATISGMLSTDTRTLGGQMTINSEARHFSEICLFSGMRLLLDLKYPQ